MFMQNVNMDGCDIIHDPRSVADGFNRGDALHNTQTCKRAGFSAKSPRSRHCGRAHGVPHTTRANLAAVILWLASLPSAVSLLLIVLAFCTYAVVGFSIARRIFERSGIDLQQMEVAPLVTMVGTAASLLFGFTIINMWANFQSCQTAVSREASLVMTVHGYFTFYPPPVRVRLDDRLADYVDEIVRDEFPALSRGERPRPDDTRVNELAGGCLLVGDRS